MPRVGSAPTGEQPQLIVESQQAVQTERAGPSRGQLDREGHAVQPLAQLGNVGGGSSEGGVDGLCAIQEQPGAVGVGRKWWQMHDTFTWYAEAFAAGREYGHVGAGREQSLDQFGDFRDQVLAVVQN